MSDLLRWAAGASLVSLLAACAIPLAQADGGGYDAARAPAPDVRYGYVSAIDAGRSPSSRSGAGAVVGGALGALIGRKIGSESDAGPTGALIGAAIGAVAGHHIEREMGSGRDSVRVTVQFDRGGVATIEQRDLGDLRVGDRVRMVNNRLERVAQGGGALQSPII